LHREPVKAVPANRATKLGGERIRRRELRDRRVKRRVEDRDLRSVRQGAPRRLDRGECRRIVERSEVDGGLQRGAERVGDPPGLGKVAAVNDPVCHSIRRDVIADGTRVVAVDEVELEARRAGVDDEDGQPGQAQFRMSGGSSPYSRPYARARRRLSIISWRRWSAVPAGGGSRAITSITRWKRSRSFSMTMSNGVVVVPSSLYPRTCRLP